MKLKLASLIFPFLAFFFSLFVSPTLAVATPGDITEYSVPSGGGLTSINPGPDSNLWFTAQNGNNIGRITPSGTITEFPVNGGPADINEGPDGNMWFTEVFGNKVGRITPSGVITEFVVPNGNEPRDITTGPDGNLWFTQQSGNKITVMNTSGNVIAEYPLPNFNSRPRGITPGPDGNLWFVEENYAKVGRITPNGVITEFDTSFNGLIDITTGSDNNLWFTEISGNRIGRITPSGIVTEFLIPTANSTPVSITSGSDGNLWFTERDGHKIGSVTTDGVFTEYTIPTANGGPFGIASGPDGNVWFTEFNGNKIGRVEIATHTPPSVTIVGGFNDTFTAPNATELHAYNPNVYTYQDNNQPLLSIQNNSLPGLNTYSTVIVNNNDFTNGCMSGDWSGNYINMTIRSAGFQSGETTPQVFYQLFSSNGNFQLNGFYNGSYHHLANGSLDMSGTHNYTICAIGSTISAYRDGVLLASANDSGITSSGYETFNQSDGNGNAKLDNLAIIASTVINEGAVYSSTGSFIDLDSSSWTAVVDYGDGAGFEPLTLNPDKTFNLSHQYTTAGEYTVTVVVEDDGGATGTTMATVFVNARPVIEQLPNEVVQEGDTYTVTGSFTDADSTSWTATVDYDEGAGSQPLTLNPDKTFALTNLYEDNGAYHVTVKVTDDNGAFDEETVTVTVNNANPQVGTITASVNPLQVFSSTTAAASFTDAGVLDTHTAVIDWGDGFTSLGDVVQNNGSGSISGSHVYLAAGVYEVTLTVTDNSNASDSEIFQYISVYNPTPQGLFSGARIFQSPAGAYTANPAFSGQAQFGVTAKYDNNNQPTGNVSLSLKAASFEFEALSITTLVTVNGKATLRGTGTVNGAGNYTFLVTGIDGANDTVRFQIKDSSNNVVYDSQPGAADTADPIASVTGQVIVH